MCDKMNHEELFHSLDTDGSGWLALDEVIAACRKQGVTDDDAKELLRQNDITGDGKLSKDEFLVAMRGAAFVGLCKEFDKDGSGSISRDELKKVMTEVHPNRQYTDQDIDQLMKTRDSDGSGDIGYMELINKI